MTHVTSLYLHIPFCRHLCNYCDFYKKKYEEGSAQIEDFHQSLCLAWDEHERMLRENAYAFAPLETVYLGGGTPSLWGEAGAKFFEDFYLSRLSLKPDCEFTMEIDPGTWTPEMIESWKKLGMNRISVGTQALHPDFLKIMDRVHSIEESLKLLKFCQDNDWNFSLDFLLGIPFSREKNRDIKTELDLLLSYDPKHISLYILNARSKYPHISHMPDDEFIRDEYLFVSEYLRSKGFHHYEVSNFARPGFESLHNQKYWESESVAAFGPSGTGYLDKGLRYKWKVSSPQAEIENLVKNEKELERVYLELRTSKGWLPESINPTLLELFSQWEIKGYGTWSLGRMKLNSQGFLMLDSLMDDLFRLKLLN
jgi:oxygen-independent coproporphyrinogen III oxidase